MAMKNQGSDKVELGNDLKLPGDTACLGVGACFSREACIT